MSRNILVADPNIEFLDVTRQILENEGHYFIQAMNGEEAKVKLEMESVDLLLANIDLPDFDGVSLCQYVKDRLQLPIPVTLMIGQGGSLPSPEALDLADGVLCRPLRPHDLLFWIGTMQGIRRLLIQNSELRKRAGGDGASPHTPPPQPQTLPPQTPPPQLQTPPPLSADSGPDDEDSPLYPMSWFRKLATLEVKRAIRFREPLSLLLMAYDMTDEYIESCREEDMEFLSQSLAHAVKAVIRDIDIPVNFSRDHILILLPNTGIEGAIQGAIRIKNAVTDLLRQDIPSELGPPSISIGATTSSTQGSFKFTDLLRDATRALREVRAQGGDSVFYC